MDDRQIRNFEIKEAEHAREDAKRGMAVWAATQNPKLLLRTVYGLDTHPIGAFLNTGSLDTVVFGSQHPCIVTIYPFPKEENLIQAYGVTAKRLESLVAEDHVIPLIQPPARYEHLPYLHPILGHKSRNYFIRSVLFYAIFFDGTTDLVQNNGVDLAPTLDRLYEKAKKSKILANILADENSGVREFYDRLPFDSGAQKARRIKENIWYRYASVAAFLGEDITDYILETYPVQRALGVLLDLHFMFDHAWTQGLLANMHNEVNGHSIDWLCEWSPTRLWWDNALSRILCVDVPFPSLSEPRLDQLDAARSDGQYDILEKSISENGLSNVEELRATLQLRIAEIEAKIDKIASRGQKIIKYRTITSVLLGLGGGVASGQGLVGAAIGLATNALLPELALKAIFATYESFVRTHNVDEKVVAYLSNVWASRPLLPHSKAITRRV